MRLNKLWIGFSILLLALAVVGCQSAADSATEDNQSDAVENNTESEELQPFNVGYLPTTGHSLYFIAEEEGYFEEAELDVSFHLFNNSGEGINAVASGQLDVGTFGTAAPLNFEEEGAELVFFGGQMGTGAGVVAKEEVATELKDPSHFKGKKVATVTLATGDVVWRGALAEAGLDWEEDLEIVEMQSPSDVIVAVQQDEVDAGVVWVPFIEMAKQEGLETVAYTDDYMQEHVCGRLISNPEQFEENQEHYVAFMEAMIKAERFEHNPANREKAVEHVAQYIDVDPTIIEKDLYDGYMVQTADPDKKAILDFRKTMLEIGYLEEERDISDLINIEVYEQALNNLLEEEPEDDYYQMLVERYEENNLNL